MGTLNPYRVPFLDGNWIIHTANTVGVYHFQLKLISEMLEMATSKTWTRTLDPEPDPGPWTLNPDSGPGPWTRTMKNLDPEKPGL